MSLRTHIFKTYTAQLVSVTGSFLCAIMAARMLGTAGQGELALYSNFLLLGSLLLSLGLPSALVHFIASGKLPKQAVSGLLLQSVFVAILLLGIVFGMITLSGSDKWLFPLIMQNDQIWLLFLGLHVIILIINAFLSSILQAESKFGQTAMVIMSSSVIMLMLYFVRYIELAGNSIRPLLWIWIAMMIAQSFQLIFYLFIIRRNHPVYLSYHQAASFSSIKPLFQFAFLAFATNSIQYLSYKMDTWFVNFWHGHGATGIYALAVSLAQMLWLLPAAVQSVLYAYLSTHPHDTDRISRTKKATAQIGIYAFAGGICGYILSMYAVPILFGEAFQDTATCIGLLLIGIVPFCLSMPVSAYFAASGRVHINFQSAVIGWFTCLLADVLLIPKMGIQGAAIASSASYLITVLYLLWHFRQEPQTRIS